MQFSRRPDITVGRGNGFHNTGTIINNNQENLYTRDNTPIIKRPEMKGPQNTEMMNTLLSGFKPKYTSSINDENDSMISATSMHEMMSQNKPRRSRKKSSEKNIISLDI